MGGRLQQFYINWTILNIDKWLLQTIRQGFIIRFLSSPPLRNHPTPITPYNLQQKELLDQEIDSLLKKGAIELTPNPSTPGFYSNMFVIPKKNGGCRPVFNLKKLNQHLYAPQFKNGGYTRGNKINKEKQLHDFHRSVRCFSTHPCKSSITQIPSFQSAKKNVSILHNTFRPVLSAMALYKTYQTDIRVGPIATNPNQCLSWRLDYNRKQCGSDINAYSTAYSKIRNIRMDHQPRKIQSNSEIKHRTSRLLIGYKENDSTAPRKETSGYSTQHTTSIEISDSIAKKDSQFDHENTSSYFCLGSSQVIHPISTEDKKSSREEHG